MPLLPLERCLFPGAYPQGPYFVPGYTGHCPERKFSVGKSYGRTTHEIMMESDVVGGRLLPSDTSKIPFDEVGKYPYVGTKEELGARRWVEEAREYWNRCMGFIPNNPHDPKEYYPPPSQKTNKGLEFPTEYDAGMYAFQTSQYDGGRYSPQPSRYGGGRYSPQPSRYGGGRYSPQPSGYGGGRHSPQPSAFGGGGHSPQLSGNGGRRLTAPTSKCDGGGRHSPQPSAFGGGGHSPQLSWNGGRRLTAPTSKCDGGGRHSPQPSAFGGGGHSPQLSGNGGRRLTAPTSKCDAGGRHSPQHSAFGGGGGYSPQPSAYSGGSHSPQLSWNGGRRLTAPTSKRDDVLRYSPQLSANDGRRLDSPTSRYNIRNMENVEEQKPYVPASHTRRVLQYEEQKRREERKKSMGFRMEQPYDETPLSRYDAEEHKWVQERDKTFSKERPYAAGRLSPKPRCDAEYTRREEKKVHFKLPNETGKVCLNCTTCAQKKPTEGQMAQREKEKTAEQRAKESSRKNSTQPSTTSPNAYAGYRRELSVIEALYALRETKALKGGHRLVIHPSETTPDGQVVPPRIYRSASDPYIPATAGNHFLQSGHQRPIPARFKDNGFKPGYAGAFRR